jgi:serine/threonine protein kinase
MPFNPGENVGAYRIIQQLGQGGMATVHKAYHAALDRYVAIKALHPAFMEDPHFLERFRREARVVAKLEHPNIVPIYDFAEHAGQPYLVMKFIEGETLKARLQRDRLPPEVALSLIKPVGEALSYAHERGILHRDIKPSNVLISSEGDVYLADFGLARIAEAGASTLSGDMLMGTPHYISPEQAKGGKDLGSGTDIYSLGVVMYELFVGRVPFDSDTPFSIIHDHIYSELPLPRDINPNVSEEVQRVLLKALAKDPLDRFAEVTELVSAVERALQGIPVDVDLSSTIPVPPEAIPEPKETAAQLKETVVDDASDELRGVAQEKAEPAKERVQRDRKKWIWIAAGLVMSCIFLFGFLSAVSNARDRSDFAAEASGEVAEFVEGRDPELLLRNAEQAVAEGDREAAFNELVMAGDLFLEADDFFGALKAYNEAWELADRQPLTVRRKLIARMTEVMFLGAPDEALWPEMDRAYDRDPELDMMKVVLARRMLFMEQPDEAIRLLDSVLSQDPDNPFARAVLAEYHMMFGDPEQALMIVQEVLESRPASPWLVDHLVYMEEEIQR